MFVTIFSRNSFKFLKKFINSLFRANSEQLQITKKLEFQVQYSTVKIYDKKLTFFK